MSLFVLYVIEADCGGGALFLCFIVVDAFVFLWKGRRGVRCDVLFVLLLKRRHDQATMWAMRELLRWRQRWRRTPACRH